MFDTIYVEHSLKEHPRLFKIQNLFPKSKWVEIESYESVFGKFRKPYLQKRSKLNLFLAQKKGQLVKPAPDAYGLSGQAHYYYIHAYNCIYECEYCYLQGYFHSPDIVIFLNHDEILQEMKEIQKKHGSDSFWFHAGEFSDSLALSHLTGELESFWPFFKENPQVHLELRTKSVNLQSLRKLPPLPNVHVSFSLGSQYQTKGFEHKTASLSTRIQAMKTLQELGFSVAIHFDPILYTASFIQDYSDLISDLEQQIDLKKISYFSLGVVRFTKEVFREVARNYPDSELLQFDMVKSFDNKIRYSRPLRMNLLKTIEKLLIHKEVSSEKIYLCME